MTDRAAIDLWLPRSGNDAVDDVAALAELLHACVLAGASVSFILPFSVDDAASFWQETVLPYVIRGSRLVLVARAGDRIVGTVQMDLAMPVNQTHRAEVKKLLVHPDWRRRGIARALMEALEREAQAIGRTMLTLDTVHGGDAERLYESMGFVRSGLIPGFAVNFDQTIVETAAILYKDLTKG